MSEYKKARILKKELEHKSLELEQKLKGEAKSFKKSASQAVLKSAAVGLGVAVGLVIIKKTLFGSKKKTNDDDEEAEPEKVKKAGGFGSDFKDRMKAALITILLDVSKRKITEIIQKSVAQPEDDTEQSDQ